MSDVDEVAPGSIWDLHPVLENPILASFMADALELGYQPQFKPTQVLTLYLDFDNGNDKNDGKTSLTAVKNVKKIRQLCRREYNTLITVNVAWSATAYDIAGFEGMNNVLWNGVPVVEETRTVTSAPTVSNTEGVVFVVNNPTGLSTLVNDVWSGRILQLSGVLANGRNIVVSSNVGNTIHGAMHNRAFLGDTQSNPNGGTVSLLKLPVFNVVGSAVFAESTDCNFQYIKFTGGSVFVNGGGKFQWLRCELANTKIVGGLGSGTAFIFSSAVAMTGETTDGILAARRKGNLQVGFGNVYVPKNLTNAAFMKIKTAEDASFAFQGGGICRALTSGGFLFDGGNAFQVQTIGTGTLSLVFETRASGSPSCVDAFTMNSLGTGSGYEYILTKCNGQISGNYFVKAQRYASVEIDANTSVVTALGTNIVSADGGTTTCAIGPDNTEIRNGSPKLPAFKKDGIMYTDLTDVGNVGAGEDNLMTYSLPAGTLGINKDYLEIEAFGTMQGNFTFALYFGATKIAEHTYTGGGANPFYVKARVYRTGAATQKAISFFAHDDADTQVLYTTPAETLANAITIKGTGTGVADNDVVQAGMTVKYVPGI